MPPPPKTNADSIEPKSPNSDSGRVYYPELDGLRFFAFLAVYIFHRGVPQFEGWMNACWRGAHSWAPRLFPISLPLRFGYNTLSNGWIGVQLFFVLSGFLIARLLLREESRNGHVDIKAFWIRRILRIWPLYYCAMLIGWVALPLTHGWSLRDPAYLAAVSKHLLPFCLFLGNWSVAFHGPPPYDELSILWTVGVEEQFYIAAPLLFVLVPKRFRMPLVISLMGFAIWRRVGFARQIDHGITAVHFQYSTLTQLDTLLAGVLLALILDGGRGKSAPRWLLGSLQAISLIGIVALATRPHLAKPYAMESGPRNPWLVTGEFVAIWATFALLIATLSLNDGIVRRFLAHRWIRWLGKVSYGLYMYHILAIRLGQELFGRLPWFANKELWQTIFAFALNVAMAAVSYQLLERPFLRLKDRWTKVPSRPI
jgi:peptidoglycan/LPS O-acetylase OafA/YrhL